jgi:hypothetical protein
MERARAAGVITEDKEKMVEPMLRMALDSAGPAET